MTQIDFDKVKLAVGKAADAENEEAIEVIDALLSKIEKMSEREKNLSAMLEECRNKGLTYWEPNTSRGHVQKADMIKRIDTLLGLNRKLSYSLLGIYDKPGYTSNLKKVVISEKEAENRGIEMAAVLVEVTTKGKASREVVELIRGLKNPK